MPVTSSASQTVFLRTMTRKAKEDGATTVLERIVTQASQFSIFILAAQILSPSEFGIFTLAFACAILVLRGSEAAWAPFIMSWAGNAERPRKVLYLAILCGIAVALLGQLGAGVVSILARQPMIGALIQLLSLWVMLATISSAQKGIMIWQQNMKASALCKIVAEMTGLIISVITLWRDYGVFGLVYGRLAAQTVHVLASFGVTRLWPSPGLSRSERTELWHFSKQIFTSRMIANMRVYSATFVIGVTLGPTAVGLFRAADRLVIAVSELVMVPGYLMAWTQLRKARDAGPPETAPERVRQIAVVFFKMLLATSLPLMTWLALMADDITKGLLADEWAPAAPLVPILALSRLIFIPGVATEPLLSITNHARRLPLITLSIFAFSVAVTSLAAQFGLFAVAWSQVFIACGVLLITLTVFQRYAMVSWTDVLGSLPRLTIPFVFATAILWSLKQCSIGPEMPSLVQAGLYSLMALIVYVAGLRALSFRYVALEWPAARAISAACDQRYHLGLAKIWSAWQSFQLRRSSKKAR